MGATYYIVSLASAGQYPWVTDALRRYEMAAQSNSESGKNPTPQEVREVLDGLSDFTVNYLVGEDNWLADVQANTGFGIFRANALINVVDFEGDESTPHLICFEKGDIKLNIQITELLSRKCGTLLLVPDTGAQPLVVTPGIDPNDAAKVWEIG